MNRIPHGPGWFITLLCAALLGCSDSEKTLEQTTDALPDTPLDEGSPSCDWHQASPSPTGALPASVSDGGGVDRWERAAYETLAEHLIADPGVHFVATHLPEEDHYRLDAQMDGVAQTWTFERLRGASGGVSYPVIEGDLSVLFPDLSSTLHGDFEDLLASFENPNGVQRREVDYVKDDPRVGFLPWAKQSFPLPLERLTALFDAPDAPDAILSLKPWSSGSAGGTHGAMSLLQSRATLILSGAGVRSGVVMDEEAILPDVSPTVLAALGSATTGGVGRYGLYDDGLYLKKQDGRVLWEALQTDACGRPKHAIVILFDGLQAGTINHLVLAENPPVLLPTFRALAAQGVVYRHGAVVGFPTVSAPGHTTAGTGVWSGRHGVVANAFFRRSTQETLNPFSLIADPVALIENPDALVDFYNKAMAPGIETMAMAAHRGLGPYDADAGTGAFVAVINEIAIGGADYTTVDYIKGLNGGQKPSTAGVDKYSLADTLAVVQIVDLLADETRPVPTLLQLSLLATDAAGEAAGPHSDLVREVLVTLDERVATILDAYEKRGALADTLVLLTADHGMELQDPSRTNEVGSALAEAGIRLHQPMGGVFYCRTLELSAVEVVEGVQIRVVNHDNQAPVVGALVTCDGCNEDPLLTDEEGRVVFTSADPTFSMTVTAAHDDYNPQSATVTEIWVDVGEGK
jgi:phosphonoacetate hydrolase